MNQVDMKKYKIHVGYTAKGNSRWKYFASLESARRAADAVFQQTGIVLSIIERGA